MVPEERDGDQEDTAGVLSRRRSRSRSSSRRCSGARDSSESARCGRLNERGADVPCMDGPRQFQGRGGDTIGLTAPRQKSGQPGVWTRV